MKKAKFNDNFRMIAGACIGHFNEQSRQCIECKIKMVCRKRTQDCVYPKNEKQVKSILNKLNI